MPLPDNTQTRRTLLYSASAGLAALLVGCENSSPAGQAQATAPTAGGPTPSSPGDALLDEVAADRSGELSVINASFETLTGDDQLFAFDLVGPYNTPVTGADVQVWIRPTEDGSANGPFDARFQEVPNQPLGLYVVRLALPVAGTIPLAAVTAEGEGGQTLLRVADVDTALVPPPGCTGTGRGDPCHRRPTRL